MDGMKIELTARQWATIDAGMDNAAQAAAELGGGEQQLAIREAGWSQVPWVGAERAWPPEQQRISLALVATQWGLIVDTLKQDSAGYRELGDRESAELADDALRSVRFGLTLARANAHAGNFSPKEFLARAAAKRQRAEDGSP